MKSNYSTAVFFGSSSFVFLNFGLTVQADELGLDAIMIGGAYTVFTGTMLLLRPLVGYCLDRFGRRWFFTSAFIFYTAAMFSFAFADDYLGLYVARFLQGIGASLMWVSARTIVTDLTEPGGLGEAMGKLTQTSVRGSMIGGFYGFTLVGMMPFSQAWYLGFIGYGVMALVALVWSLLRVRETRQEVGPRMQRFGWRELKQNPDLIKALIIAAITGFAAALIEPVYLLLLKHNFDVSVIVLAFVFLPSGLVFAFIPKYAGRFADKWGRGLTIALGVSLAAVVGGALPFWSSLILIAASYILFAVGWAMASPAVDGLVASFSDDTNRGRVMGAKEAAAGLGAALGPLLGGYLYDSVNSTAPFLFNAGLLLLVALIAVLWFGNRSATDTTLSVDAREQP